MSANLTDPCIRLLEKKDIDLIVYTFNFPWTTPEEHLKKWKQYYHEQQQKKRIVLLIEYQGQLAGYGSLLHFSNYLSFREKKIPEISDVWIASEKRRIGLGQTLIQSLEQMAVQKGYPYIGIGFGLYQDYGAAQKLYTRLGYLPDGKGVSYKGLPITPGESYPIDDDLVLWLIKSLI